MANQSHFTLWQLPSLIGSIGMCYVLRTQNGKIIVFDGGWEQESAYLRGFLAAVGNKVDVWFISHPHDDHAGVLMGLLNDMRDLKIDKIYQSSLDPEWYSQFDSNPEGFTSSYYKAVENSGVESIEAEPGMEIVVDGVLFEVLSKRNPEITANSYNEQCVVVKATDAGKTVLFLGDLGVESGKKLLAGPYGGKVKAEYVQMAHHGQKGVDEDFYRAVDPKYCLWPTPKWLWENDAGDGFNTGPYETLKTREWMSKLNIEKHYLSFEGLVRID